MNKAEIPEHVFEAEYLGSWDPPDPIPVIEALQYEQARRKFVREWLTADHVREAIVQRTELYHWTELHHRQMRERLTPGQYADVRALLTHSMPSIDDHQLGLMLEHYTEIAEATDDE